MSGGRYRRAYASEGVRQLPASIKSVGKFGLELYASARRLFGHNQVTFEYEGRTFTYQYVDGASFLYLSDCLTEETITHEQLPIGIVDLPDRYDVAIDVGAHFGVYSVLLGGLNDVDLYCFEPSEENAEILRANLRANGIDGVVDERVVTDETGPIEFYVRQRFDTVSHSTNPPAATSHQYERVDAESVALSSVLADYEDADVFAKIDAEGEEDGIVRDLLACESIASLTGILELHLNKLDGETILADLRENGFTVEKISHMEQSPNYFFTNVEAPELRSALERAGLFE